MNKKNKIFGIITLVVSIIWLLFNLKTYYDYNYTSIVSIGILKQKVKPFISTIIIFITYLFLFGLECYLIS